jgi:hypothetical protein
MATDSIDPLDVARDRLGEPEASYRVGAGRFWTKFTLGAALVAYGVAANLLAWQFGIWGVDHTTLLVLFAPPLTGLSILRQLYVSRGLVFHVYPTGLLRVQGRQVQAFPWDALAGVAVRAEQATALVFEDGDRVTDCRLIVVSPVLRLSSAAVTLTRDDGEYVEVTAAIADYPELVEEILSRSFAEAWPRLLADLRTGGVQTFGPWIATQSGLRCEAKVIPWAELKLGGIASKLLTIDHPGGRPGRWTAPLESILFPHLLIALLAAARPAPLA